MAVQGKPQFLPRDAYAVTVPSQDVRLSVCPSHAVIESKLLYISSECFHCRVAPPVQFSHTKRDGDIPNGGAECKGGYEKITIFDQYLALSGKMMQDRAIVTMQGEQEIAPKLSNGTGLNDLE